MRNRLKGNLPTSRGRRVATGLAMAGCALTINACAITQPYVHNNEPRSGSDYASARDYALKVAKKFDSKLDDLEGFDVASGALLFGSGIAGVAFGLFDGHRDALIGSALVGGTAAGARTFLPITDRKSIYGTGSAAIHCAIAATTLGQPDDGAVQELRSVLNENAILSLPLVPDEESRKTEGSGAFSAAFADLNQATQRLKSIRASSGVTSNERFLSAGPAPRAALESLAVPRSGPSALAPEVRAEAIFAAREASRLDEKTQATIDASTDLMGAMGSVIEVRAELLYQAVSAIVAESKRQLMVARIDPEGALKAAQSGIKPFLDNIDAGVKSVKDKAEETTEQAADTAKATEGLKAEAGKAGSTESLVAAAKADEVEGKADAAANTADRLKTIAARIAVFARLPADCLGNTETEG